MNEENKERNVQLNSFIFMPAFPLGRVAGAAALRGLEMPQHGQQQFQVILLAPRQYRTKQGRSEDVSTPPGPWTTSGPLSRGFSQQNLPRQSFVGHSGHMAEPTCSWDLSMRRSGSTFRALRISQLRLLSGSVTPWTLRKNPISAACS